LALKGLSYYIGNSFLQIGYQDQY